MTRKRAPAPVTIPAGLTKAELFVKPRAAGEAVISAAVPDRTTQPARLVVTGAGSVRKRVVR